MNKKYYTLEAVVDGRDVKFSKTFKSRNNAISYMFDYFNKKGYYNVEVNDEYQYDDNKHDIEYVCNYYNRFRVNRVLSIA